MHIKVVLCYAFYGCMDLTLALPVTHYHYCLSHTRIELMHVYVVCEFAREHLQLIRIHHRPASVPKNVFATKAIRVIRPRRAKPVLRALSNRQMDLYHVPFVNPERTAMWKEHLSHRLAWNARQVRHQDLALLHGICVSARPDILE